VTDDDVVLATNTSTLSITTIASATDRASDVIGLHFMNPVPIMDGVEVVVGERTADPVVDFAHAFAEDLGKETWEADDKARLRHEPDPDAVDQRGRPRVRRGRRRQGRTSTAG